MQTNLLWLFVDKKQDLKEKHVVDLVYPCTNHPSWNRLSWLSKHILTMIGIAVLSEC